MRTLTLPRHYWLSFRRHFPVDEQERLTPPVAVHDTKPRAPAAVEERFWELSHSRVWGIQLPNRYQTLFLGGLCITLALPVFFLDQTGHGLYHGLVTLASLTGFAAFCWIVGMLLANTVGENPKKSLPQTLEEHRAWSSSRYL